MRRGRTRLIAIVVAVVIVVGGGLALWRSPLFAVKKVQVTGAKNLKLEQVLKLAQVPKDATLLRLPSEEIRGRLLKSSWIADVKLQRRFPDTLRIDLTERQPVALAEGGGAIWLVDRDSFVIGKSSDASTTYVVIRDAEGFKPKQGVRSDSKVLANALAVLTGISRELRAEVRSMSAASVDQTTLFTREGVEVLIGPASELEKKDYLARKMLAEQRGKVVFIDVRTTDRPVYRGLGE